MRHGVILAGGGGTRLWPASRRKHPKQLLRLSGPTEPSLLQATITRLEPSCDRLVIVCHHEQADDIARQVPELDNHIIGEPAARNTAAAIGLTCLQLVEQDPDAIIAVLPSDHVITPDEDFHRAADIAFRCAKDSDDIVTFGVVPTRPETGYGYIQVASGWSTATPSKALCFVEKPDANTAQGYLRDGNYLWNSGMFFAKAQRFLDELHLHSPKTSNGLRTLVDITDEADRKKHYERLPSISIDHAVMEKTERVQCIPVSFAWNDVGSWPAVAPLLATDANDNASVGDTVCVDARGNLLMSDAGLTAVVGVDNLVVVRHGDAVLVVPKERAQETRAIVQALRDGKLDRYL